MTVAAGYWYPFSRYRESQGIDPLIWLSSSLLCTCNRMFQNLCLLWAQTTCDKITRHLNITELKEGLVCLQFVGEQIGALIVVTIANGTRFSQYAVYRTTLRLPMTFCVPKLKSRKGPLKIP